MADCDSAPSCTNISIMQLFHELKQKFPAVPDRVVSECIRQNSNDKDACEAILRRENQGYLLHSYPVALKMSSESTHNSTSACDHSLLNNEVISSTPTSVANRQMLSVATNNRPSNFEFLTNVVDNSGSGNVTYSQSERTVSVVTYSSEQRPENYELNVNYRASPNTSPCPRVRSALQVSPSPHYHCKPPSQQARSYTSVNLTLRPPSSEPQPPIDIQSAGSVLTYSTCTYDRQQGYQSQLQIRIGPGGMGTVSALRTQLPPPLPHYTPQPLQQLVQLREKGEESTELESTQASTQALLLQQLERKSKLQRELHKEKENLKAMQREVHEMKKDLEQRQRHKQTLSLPIVSTVLNRVQELRNEIQRLQEECKKMTQEVDLNLDARVPLGETDEEFYKNIYTGQRGFILPPPPRPPPLRPDPIPGPGRRVQSSESEGPHWTCSQCTFRNHPLLDKCETCDMPRIMLGSNSCYCHPAPYKTCVPNPLTPLPVMHAEKPPPAEQA